MGPLPYSCYCLQHQKECFTLPAAPAANFITGSRTEEESKRKERPAFMWGACKCDISLVTEGRNTAEVGGCKCEYPDLPDCWGSCGDITHSREIQTNAVGSTSK